MTQPSRTTENLSRDNEAIREIMHQIRDRLTVPDRATLALGLVGHLATMMNHRQMEKLLGELSEEAEKVLDVPPARRAQQRERTGGDEAEGREAVRGERYEAKRVGQAGRGAVTEDEGRML